MTLTDLRRYLTNKKKLGFTEHPRSSHFHYQILFDDRSLYLPTIVCVSNGGGDAKLNNVKGVAQALGLSLNELKISEACHIGRFCLLVRLAWRLIDWCNQRLQVVQNDPLGMKGVKAMIESVSYLLDHIEKNCTTKWKKEEKEALSNIRGEVEMVLGRDLLAHQADRVIKLIDRP